MESVWEDMRQCHRLRNEMAHLVTSLQAYIMFEVVEAAWTGFMEALRTTQDLDGLIRIPSPSLVTILICTFNICFVKLYYSPPDARKTPIRTAEIPVHGLTM
jgi:hypothetical protein